MLKDAIDFTKLHRVLVVKLRHHGDVLLTSPLFSVLKNHHPHLELDALVYQETEEMLSLHPAISQLHTVDRNWKRRGLGYQIAQEWALLRSLRARRYDLLILLTEQWRGALLKQALGIPYAVVADYGRRQSWFWKQSFSHIYPQTPQRHKVEFHLDALRRVGLTPQLDERSLSFVMADADVTHAQALLRQAGVTGLYVVLHPASRWGYKCWEIDKYAALIERLRHAGYTLVLTGAASRAERHLIAAIQTRVTQAPVDLSGKLTLKQLGAVIQGAACFVGVDSMPMHLAAALDTPVVALFGPSSQAIWRPWARHYEIVSSRRSCQPCFQHGCGNSEVSDCLQNIVVDQVYGAVRRMSVAVASPAIEMALASL